MNYKVAFYVAAGVAALAMYRLYQYGGKVLGQS
jgi:hypothetical protein